jgi:two-component system, cell cycle response regulator DivK
MSPLPSDCFVSLRAEARVLLQRAGDQEQGLAALAAAAENDVRRAKEALSNARRSSRVSVNHLQTLLSTQLRRSQDGAKAARQLCADAHEQYAAADVLLRRLDGELEAAPGSGQRPRRHAVLVVDDYLDVRDVVAEILRHAGFLVRTAANGLEGLLAAHEMRPAVIVMDVTMPVLDGIEATRLIKAAEATRQARVIAYTGNATLGDEPSERLFAAILQKPATPETLLATVQHVANL